MPVHALDGEEAELELGDLVVLRAQRDLAFLCLVRSDVLDDGDRAAFHVLDLVLELLALRPLVEQLALEVLDLLDHRRRVELLALDPVEKPREPPHDRLLPGQDGGGRRGLGRGRSGRALGRPG